MYRSLRDLAWSYFDPYVDFSGRLKGYGVTSLYELGNYDWRFSSRKMTKIEDHLAPSLTNRCAPRMRVTRNCLPAITFTRNVILTGPKLLRQPPELAAVTHITPDQLAVSGLEAAFGVGVKQHGMMTAVMMMAPPRRAQREGRSPSTRKTQTGFSAGSM